jgi:nucleoside-triphosphatase
VAEELKPLHPAGFFTSEIREANTRKGFGLRSLNGKDGLLAHMDITTPYRVGKYKVDVKGFEAFLGAIPLLGPSVRLIIIDEIGKMECFSDLFRHLVRQVLDSDKVVLATIALKGEGFIEKIKKKRGCFTDRACREPPRDSGGRDCEGDQGYLWPRKKLRS